MSCKKGMHQPVAWGQQDKEHLTNYSVRDNLWSFGGVIDSREFWPRGSRPAELTYLRSCDSVHFGGSMIQTAFRRAMWLVHLALALSAATLAQTPKPALSASEVMQRVIAATGATVPANTFDTLKAGDPGTVVTGIVTTFMDTYPVLEKAVASGKNLIITHEPTFYNADDDQAPLAADPVQQQKLAYIREHHLVVWRFHDTWHLRQPDGILAGMVDQFGWKAYQNGSNPHLFTLPPTTVEQIASRLQARTGARALRIVGDPAMKVTGVALLPGASGAEKQIKMLELDQVQLLVAGEAREWETVPYVQDAVAEGRHKALILLGHEVSEEAGMVECAHWLHTLFPEIPVEFIPAGEPFQAVRP
jgi:putative NIF3 family GTP cyclohydrolase 1 type 2